MTKKQKNTAFILSTRKWSDNSLIVTVFSKEQGLLKFIAKGALKPKSPFRGRLEVFNLAEIVYSEKSTRQLQILTEIDVISGFSSIRGMPAGTAGLFVMAEIILNLIHEHEEVELFFRHLTRLLEWLNENPENISAGLLNFIAAILTFSGYGLNFSHCTLCGITEVKQKIFVDMENGNYYCYKCKSTVPSSLQSLPGEIIQLLRNTNPYKNLIQNKVNVPQPILSSFLYFLNDYLSYHLGRRIVLQSSNLYLSLL